MRAGVKKNCVGAVLIPLAASLVLLPDLSWAYTVVEAEGRIVEISGLSDDEGCAFAAAVGKVGKVDEVLRGGLPDGFYFSDQYGESYVNIDAVPNDVQPDTRRKIIDGLTAFLKTGTELEIGLHGCGAAARIQSLVWAKLIRGAESAAPAGKPNSTISGELAYPSDEIPPDLKICAEHVESKQVICTAKHFYKEPNTYYAIAVPAGSYRVFAQHTDPSRFSADRGSDYRAYYSEFVTCGYQASCPSHEPITVEAVAGKTARADPNDWYVSN